jgi:hypothetical protein
MPDDQEKSESAVIVEQLQADDSDVKKKAYSNVVGVIL